MKTLTATGPVNIAVIKYWGKKDEELILPVNGSISITLDQAHMRAKTTVAASSNFDKDRFWLNSKEIDVSRNSRLQRVLSEIRRRARKRPCSEEGEENGSPMVGWKVHICSENNFPTAAGLASSAAGFACLVFALAKLYNVSGNISEIARQGSGSACRSIYGGFVEWMVGTQNDGSDSIARQIVAEDHWPDLSVLIIVVSESRKLVPSTIGMRRCVETSDLLDYRSKHLVPRLIVKMTEAIRTKDFQKFAELTMKDSNQMHAVCLDSYPPISYLTDVSHDIIRLVTAVNDHYKENKVAYTFDAGPNACLYLLRENVPSIVSLVQYFFPSASCQSEYVKGIPVEVPAPNEDLISSNALVPRIGAIQYLIHTKMGPGPMIINDPSESLLEPNGYPLH